MNKELAKKEFELTKVKFQDLWTLLNKFELDFKNSFEQVYFTLLAEQTSESGEINLSSIDNLWNLIEDSLKRENEMEGFGISLAVFYFILKKVTEKEIIYEKFINDKSNLDKFTELLNQFGIKFLKRNSNNNISNDKKRERILSIIYAIISNIKDFNKKKNALITTSSSLFDYILKEPYT
jgi:hypothetical protein